MHTEQQHQAQKSNIVIKDTAAVYVISEVAYTAANHAMASGAARILSRGGHSVWSFDKSRPMQFIYLEAKVHYKRKV